MKCLFCKGECCRAGRQKNGVQKYFCKGCKKYQQASYRYKAYKLDSDEWIARLVCEGAGVRGTARLLEISTGTVLRRIGSLAGKVRKPPIVLNQAIVEIDELRTFTVDS